MNLLSLFRKKSDKQTINLLPEEAVASAGFSRDIIVAVSIPGVVLVMIILAFGAVFLLTKQEEFNNGRILSQIDEQKALWQQFSTVANNIVEIKSSLKPYTESVKQTEGMANALVTLRNDLPPGIILSRIDIKTGGATSIDGSSSNPKIVYQYAEVLKNNTSKYSGVIVKSVNYQSGVGYRFTIEMKIK